MVAIGNKEAKGKYTVINNIDITTIEVYDKKELIKEYDFAILEINEDNTVIIKRGIDVYYINALSDGIFEDVLNILVDDKPAAKKETKKEAKSKK